MPTYDYMCNSCGYEFAEVQHMTDAQIKDCPKCGKKECVEKIILGGGGFRLKGEGWFADGYQYEYTSMGGENKSAHLLKDYPKNSEKPIIKDR